MRRILTLCLLFGVTAVFGQEAVPPAEMTATPTAAAVDIPEELSSARATMGTFLLAFYAEEGADLARAASCLDLSALPNEVRALKGRELAGRLKAVIDRTRYVELDEIPDDPEGQPYVFIRRPEGEVVIARTGTGEWLFTAETVAGVEDLFRAVEGREVVQGVARAAPTVITPADWLRELMPQQLRREFLVLEAWQWLGILMIILAGVVIHRVFVFLTSRALQRLMMIRFPSAGRSTLLRVANPAGMLLMLIVWGLGIAWLGLPVAVFNLYYKAVKLLAIVAAAVIAYRFVDLFGEFLDARAQATDTRFDNLLVPLIRKSLKVFVVAVGLLTVAQTLGTDITALLAGLGIGGLAVALAAQDTVGNLFGSLTVLIDRPFQVGDWVVVGDVEGTVEEVGFRSTRIRTFYNSLITLPNSNLIKASVDNLGDRTYRRWKTRLEVTYATPPEKIDAFCEGVRELIRQHPYTRKNYFHVYLNDFGAASLEILLYMFFATPDWATELRERHRLGVDILRLAKDLGVEFAFPTRTVYLRSEEWSSPHTAGEGYPAASEEFSSRARHQARNLVQGVLGGEVPPPVTFDVPPEENRGEAEE